MTTAASSPNLVAAEPLPAATVMLLRDGTCGLEVLLLKRHRRSDVHGGVHVFPGGKVDAADAKVRFGPDAFALQAGFGDATIDAARAATLYAAAMRELTEECSVAIVDTGQMHPHSRWITPQPSTSPKRFDTWFFVALLPAGQTPRHDGHEAVESIWLHPRAALRRYWVGTLLLAPPQLSSLAALSRHATAGEALAAARTRCPPRIQPEHVGDGNSRFLAFPGDPAHSIATAALPGPTRFVWRNGRYEPEAGFDGFFS